MKASWAAMLAPGDRRRRLPVDRQAHLGAGVRAGEHPGDAVSDLHPVDGVAGLGGDRLLHDQVGRDAAARSSGSELTASSRAAIQSSDR